MQLSSTYFRREDKKLQVLLAYFLAMPNLLACIPLRCHTGCLCTTLRCVSCATCVSCVTRLALLPHASCAIVAQTTTRASHEQVQINLWCLYGTWIHKVPNPYRIHSSYITFYCANEQSKTHKLM